MNYKKAFETYCDDRDYYVSNIIETPTGIVASVANKTAEPVNVKYFTQILNQCHFAPQAGTVRLSYKDFHNEEIHEGLIEQDCNHFDTRICDALGHA